MVSDIAKKQIKAWEGCRLAAYRCPGGVWTIGYGHTGSDVREGMRITAEEADRLFDVDVAKHESLADGVLQRHGVSALNQNQRDAVVSLVYNIGIGNFERSTLLKKMRRNVFDKSIADEFRKWNKSGGKVLAGLVKRREWEAKWYFHLFLLLVLSAVSCQSSKHSVSTSTIAVDSVSSSRYITESKTGFSLEEYFSLRMDSFDMWCEPIVVQDGNSRRDTISACADDVPSYRLHIKANHAEFVKSVSTEENSSETSDLALTDSIHETASSEVDIKKGSISITKPPYITTLFIYLFVIMLFILALRLIRR